MAMVKFVQGTKAQYDALTTKDANTLYFLTDTFQIMKGANAYTQKVIVTDSVPTGTGIQGVLYVCTANNNLYYWTGTAFKTMSVELVDVIDANATDAVAPTAKAVKTYVDNKIANIDMTRVDALEEKVDTEGKVSVAIEAAKTAAINAAASDAASKVATAKDEAAADATAKADAAQAAAIAAAATDATTKAGTAKSEAIAASAVTMKSEAGEGDVATIYTFTQNGVEIGSINIGKELMVESGNVEDVEGVPHLKLTLNDTAGTVVDIDLSKVFDVYTSGNGIQVGTDNKVSVVKAADSEDFLVVDENGVAIKGVADAIATAKSEAIAAVVGTDADTKESDTIKGAKKYADDKLNIAIGGANEALIGTSADTTEANTIWGAKNYGADKAATAEANAKAYADAEIQKLDADLDAAGTLAKDGVMVVAGVTQVDGKLTAVDSVEVEKAGAASKALSDAQDYADQAEADAIAAVVGSDDDAKTADTVKGAKAYADDAILAALTWTTIA